MNKYWQLYQIRLVYTEILHNCANLPKKAKFGQIASSPRLFTPTCKYFYTDISVISATFRNSLLGGVDQLHRWNLLLKLHLCSHSLRIACKRFALKRINLSTVDPCCIEENHQPMSLLPPTGALYKPMRQLVSKKLFLNFHSASISHSNDTVSQQSLYKLLQYQCKSYRCNSVTIAILATCCDCCIFCVWLRIQAICISNKLAK